MAVRLKLFDKRSLELRFFCAPKRWTTYGYLFVSEDMVTKNP
ncbi:hypothetical protein KNP414_04373 [Paenibacillus mucilaginosus KNP414]|uniref:Uncharacterized protein n=1 Tax=Paenibacillus mucilaginosus (strain KNP414) TaxID=1036673 RepID=F8F6F1_PAEMK|nr:hypothetical protein KNP414_04373 [Paenibacillus mucilaginosus KNP414]